MKVLSFKQYLNENINERVKFFIDKYVGTKDSKSLLKLVQQEYSDELEIIKDWSGNRKVGGLELIDSKDYKGVISYLKTVNGKINRYGKYIITTPKIIFPKNKIWYRSEGINSSKPKLKDGVIYFAEDVEGAEYFDDGNGNTKNYKLNIKRTATVSELKRITDKRGNRVNSYRRDTISHLETAEIKGLIADGFDSAYGSIEGIGGMEIAVFDLNQIKEIT